MLSEIGETRGGGKGFVLWDGSPLQIIPRSGVASIFSGVCLLIVVREREVSARFRVGVVSGSEAVTTTLTSSVGSETPLRLHWDWRPCRDCLRSSASSQHPSCFPARWVWRSVNQLISNIIRVFSSGDDLTPRRVQPYCPYQNAVPDSPRELPQ